MCGSTLLIWQALYSRMFDGVVKSLNANLGGEKAKNPSTSLPQASASLPQASTSLP